VAADLSPSSVVFRPATPSRWPDVEKLFGERGACGGCWCMAWRLRRTAFEAGKGALNRERLRHHHRLPGARADRMVRRGAAPRARQPRAVEGAGAGGQHGRVVDLVPVRAEALPEAGALRRPARCGCQLAARQGARVVEGYPVEPSKGKMADVFAWTGLPSAFLKAGFVEVARRSPTRPIMRRMV
jgi:hypothetical protein